MSEKNIYKILSLSRSADLNSLYSKHCYKFNSISPLKSKYYIGIDFYSKEVSLPNGLDITLHFWDLSFQVTFNILLERLVKHVDAGLLVFDMNSKKSLEGIEMYLPILRAHDPIFPLIIFGNKGSMMIERLIGWEDLNKFCLANKIELCFEIALKEENDDKINSIFLNIAKLLVNIVPKKKLIKNISNNIKKNSDSFVF